MSAKRHERTVARRGAVQVLYQSEILHQSINEIIDEKSYLTEDEVVLLTDYAIELLRGVERDMADVDKYLSTTSENWSLARMPMVDRSILRLATYEMMYIDDVPVSVSINEAVELAKDFGGEDDSPRFVNGVLGQIAKRLEEEKVVKEQSDE